MPTLFFYAFAVLALISSILVIVKKDPVASSLSLILVFFAFAGIYALLEAHLVAALQILVYAGAVMVLFVFVIMLLHDPRKLSEKNAIGAWVAVPVVFLFFTQLVMVFRDSPVSSFEGGFSPEQIEVWGGNTEVIAETMFSKYLFPFELISVLLLAAMVGAIALSKRHSQRSWNS
jgi:NADH-quinone oxidoreductase subunit J